MNSKTKYDLSLLSWRIRREYKTLDDFCRVAQIDQNEFKKALRKSNLTEDHIKSVIDVLGIAPEEIKRYFYTPLPDGRGRPTKDIQKITTPPQNNIFYTITEASLLLNVHRHTLQARLRHGQLKGKLMGNTWRIYKDELFDNSDHVYLFDCEDTIWNGVYLTPSQINHMENGTDNPLCESYIVDIARRLKADLYRFERTTDEKEDGYINKVCVYDCME